MTSIFTASISARNFADYFEEKQPNEPDKIKLARRFGFFQPIGLFIVSVAALLCSLSYGSPGIGIFAFIIVGVAYTIITSSYLQNRTGIQEGILSRAFSSLMILVAIFIIEFSVTLQLIGHGLELVYLMVAITFDIFLIVGTFRKKYEYKNETKVQDGAQNPTKATTDNTTHVPHASSPEEKKY